MADEAWTAANARSIGMRLGGPDGSLLVLVNAYWEDLEFVLPQSESGPWRSLLDTTGNKLPEGPGATYCLKARSLALLTNAAP